MKRFDFFSFLFLLLVSILFFYQFFLFSKIPFPGDLLATLAPYKAESFLGYAPGGYPTKFQGADVIHEMYPWRFFSIQRLKQGHIPFWDPYNFSGNLLMQNFQSSIFSPPSILFFLFSFSTAWGLFIFLQPLLASFFMYLFLRDLRLGKIASIIGSIAFAFSSYMVVWMEYGNIDYAFLWLPLLLLLLTRFFQEKKLRYFLFLQGAFLSMILAGYIQGVFYLYVLSFSYLLFQRFCAPVQTHSLATLSHHQQGIKKDSLARFVMHILLVFGLPLLFTSFQLLPTFYLFRDSTRGNYSLSQIQQLLQPVFYWVTVFVPDYFGNPAVGSFWMPITYIERVMYAGVPIVFFAFYALFAVHHSVKNFFAIVCGIVLLLVTNLPGIAFLYRLPIPVLSTTVPTRMVCLFLFAIIVVASFGIDSWLTQKKLWKAWYPFGFLGIYLLIGIGTVLLGKYIPAFSPHVSVALRSLLFSGFLASAVVLIFYLRRISRALGQFLLLALVLFDLFYFFHKITPFVPKQLLYPKTGVVLYLQMHGGINRFWGYGGAYIPANVQTVDGTYSPEGDDPLHLSWYGEFLSTTGTGQIPSLLPRPDANISSGFGRDGLRSNGYRQRALDILGVRYLIAQRLTLGPDYDTFPEKTYSLVWEDRNWQVYRNNEALPRYFLTSQYLVANSNRDSIQKIYHSQGKTIILHSNLPVPLSPHAVGTVDLLYYKEEAVGFRTHSTGRMLLFLSDTYHPYWQVTIDGKKTSLLKADYAFRAVVVPKGDHLVRMQFVPEDFYVGLWIAFLGVFIGIGYCFFLQRRVQ